jgi:hypothetical protein
LNWLRGDGDFNNEGIPDVFAGFSSRVRSLVYFNIDMGDQSDADWRIGTGGDDAYSEMADTNQGRLGIP